MLHALLMSVFYMFNEGRYGKGVFVDTEVFLVDD